MSARIYFQRRSRIVYLGLLAAGLLCPVLAGADLPQFVYVTR